MSSSQPQTNKKKALIALLAGALPIAFVLFLSAGDLVLTFAGTTTEGTVTGKTREEGTGDSPDRYFLAYRFEHEGVPVEGKDEVKWPMYTDYDTGDAIEVRYRPGDPQLNAVRGPRWFMIVFVLALGSIFIKLGIGDLLGKRRSADPGA